MSIVTPLLTDLVLP